MSIWVCLQCGVFKHEGWWFECAACGYAPENPESLAKQLLAQADSITPRLEEIARNVKAGEPVPFDLEEVRANWTTKTQVLEDVRECKAIERSNAPIAANRSGMNWMGWLVAGSVRLAIGASGQQTRTRLKACEGC
jgi:hypothetical protein